MKFRSLAVGLAILAGGATLASANTIQVGPTRTYTTVMAGYNAASSGDVIEIDSGYYYQSQAWVYVNGKNNLTFRGVGPTRPVLDGGGSLYRSKGIFVIEIGTLNTTIENLEIENTRFNPDVAGSNAAGVRAQGTGLTLRNCYIHDCDDGVLNGGGDMLFEYCEFYHNGQGDGQSHNIYIGSGTNSFTMQYCYSHGTVEGHEVKTRADSNYMLYNLIVTEGTGSREIQYAQGGNCYAIGNVVVKGVSAHNGEMISYGGEGTNGNPNLYVINNTLINYKGGTVGLMVSNPPNVAVLQNTIMQSVGTPIGGTYAGSVTSTTNWITSNAYLVNPSIADLSTFDARLTTSSTGALNAGTAPGTGYAGYSLTPVYQYLAPCNYEARPVQGAIDIGAYEFHSSTNTPPVVDAGADQTIQFPAAATLAGSAVDDGLPTPPGMMTYTWTKASGPGSVNFADPSALSTTATFSVGGTYVLQLAAYDGALTGTDTVTITVNTAPTVHINAGPNWAYEDWPITLNCSASDADGDTLNYAWSQTSGVAMALAGAATSSVSFTTPHMLGTIHDASMSLRVTVSDGKGGTASDTISLFVYMTGDINQDYNVNLGDLKLLVAAWNSWPGRTNWNPAADLDNNGSVTLSDLKLQLLNWNRAMLP